ncbi:hypothetical protein MPTK1_7g15890 [Marchantia polymorpha subsp. ruderalis]|uniref:Uncharacterized protein n=2 Tax=Marchantia polymorpha TaxID=3197 RepID=A0AAF6C045_MARPO|nr:hypothetical protein MARPO_0111s0030 [Marchantia polymorpha]BBN17629.1 hypothetical protein Mp_7g15890 [Marchantia polymorpha subsp. ruderalis]|eukprot:PTQ31472.1 hypothetical protein MARPO_0111s0030 [Marchantia polymorpha]
MRKWRTNFEEEKGGIFSLSKVPIRIAVCKCSWMVWCTVLYGGMLFWALFLVFQITPPWMSSFKPLSRGASEWTLLHNSVILGTEVGLLAMVALITFLVPALIMTWITALVFEYMFGRGLFGRPQRLIEDGSMIARDISWMAFKSVVKEGNVVAVIVVIICMLTCGSMRGYGDSEVIKATF